MTRTHTSDHSHRHVTALPNSKASQTGENGMVMDLSAAEIRSDLVKILTYLKTNLASQHTDTSPFLTNPVQALLYAERVASYALHDYPRQFQGDTRITVLWDTLNRIAKTVAEWRDGDDQGDGELELAVLRDYIELALADSQVM